MLLPLVLRRFRSLRAPLCRLASTEASDSDSHRLASGRDVSRRSPEFRVIQDKLRALLKQEKLEENPLRPPAERPPPPPNQPKRVAEFKVDSLGRSIGVGKRKTSIAHVTLAPGTGMIFVNNRLLKDYFHLTSHLGWIVAPFFHTATCGMYDVFATVKGGGLSGQADAIRLGIARALQAHDPPTREDLRDGPFLTRDTRVVERKKPGQKKARKQFQYPTR
eukprot:TRINITY_DN537_c0_g1_i1.p1 TRINITY_DN537_c0_g1~~TRINITY_DN537_c0_g1_i1.p1  ORF type:complete len:220 (-),score=51.60 TRINITY_DN537_c0_g1_i1:112-771(-)